MIKEAVFTISKEDVENKFVEFSKQESFTFYNFSFYKFHISNSGNLIASYSMVLNGIIYKGEIAVSPQKLTTQDFFKPFFTKGEEVLKIAKGTEGGVKVYTSQQLGGKGK